MDMPQHDDTLGVHKSGFLTLPLDLLGEPEGLSEVNKVLNENAGDDQVAYEVRGILCRSLRILACTKHHDHVQ